MDRTGGSRTIEVVDCAFHRRPDRAVYRIVHDGDPVTVTLEANAYLMNGRGDTVDKFSIRQAGTLYETLRS